MRSEGFYVNEKFRCIRGLCPNTDGNVQDIKMKEQRTRKGARKNGGGSRKNMIK